MNFLISILCAVFISVFNIIPTFAAQDPKASLKNKEKHLPTNRVQKGAKKNRFAPKTVIIKLKKDSVAAKSFFDLSDSTQPTDMVTKSWSSSQLDQLKQKYGVKTVRPFFKETQNVNGKLKRIKAADKAYLTALESGTQNLTSTANVPDLENIYILEIANDEDTLKAVEEFRSLPEVEYAEPDYEMKINAFPAPTDTYYNSIGSWGQNYADLWGFKQMKTKEAWDAANLKGDNIVVAVVDSGVDYTHPDIDGNMWINTSEIAGNNIDDDGNGYIDDVKGWDFVNSKDNNNDGDYSDAGDVRDADPMDDNGHGTHVAGTIAAEENGAGIVGIAPKAKIMPLKALSASGSGSLSGLAKAIIYAANKGAKVINNSWGCSGGCSNSQVISDAIKYAANTKDAVVVFAAGNDNEDVEYYGQAAMPEVISVAASTETDQHAYFSNYGLKVDVAAPGGGDTVGSITCPECNILSLLSSKAPADFSGNGALKVGTQYLRIPGTSMAAPHVSGLAALIRAYRPTYSQLDVRNAIMASADDKGAVGKDTSFGFGRVNAQNAMSATPKVLMGAQKTSIIDTNGNNNGYFNTGENVQLKINVKNLWSPTTSSTTATLIPTDPTITFSPANVSIPALATGQETDISFNIAASGTSSSLRTIAPFKLQLGSYITDNFTLAEPVVPRTYSLPNAYDSFSPDVSGNKIVYVGLQNGARNIYIYDTLARTTQQITNTATTKALPKISGDYVVWYEGPPLNIKLYKLSTGALTSVTNSTTNQKINPEIDGNNVAWIDYDTGEVYYYNISTTQTQKIGFGYNPKVSGNRLAYQKPGGLDLYVRDLTNGTETAVATNTYGILDVAIDGTKIVWAEWDGYGEYEVKLKDLSSTASTKIIGTIVDQFNGFLSINSNRVAWSEFRGGRWVQFVFDITANKLYRIPFPDNIDADYSQPLLDGRKMVWDVTNTLLNQSKVYLMNFNTPPFMGYPDPQLVAAGSTITFTVQGSDLDGDAITYSMASTSTGATFNPATRTFSWTPTAAQISTTPYSFAIKGTDPSGEYGEAAFKVMVVNSASIPALTNPVPGTVLKQSPTTFTWSAGTATSYNLAVGTTAASVKPPPDGVMGDIFKWNGSLTSLNVTGIKLNGSTIYVRLYFDLNGVRFYKDYSFATDPTNQAPFFQGVFSSYTANPGVTTNINLNPYDPNGDAFTCSMTHSITGTLPKLTGCTFSWAPSTSQISATPYNVTFTVTDGKGGSTTKTIPITVKVGNLPPVITLPATQTIAAGNTVSFTVSASDTNSADTVIVYMDSANTGATGSKGELFTAPLDRSNPYSGTFTWTPTAAYVSGTPYTFTFRAFDNQSAYDIKSVQITVTSPTGNAAPVFDAVSAKSVVAGSPLSFTVNATDANGDPITYAMNATSTGATFNASTKTFSWTPTTAQVSATPYTFTFTASDGKGGTGTLNVAVTVTAPVTQLPALTAPTAGTTIGTTTYNFTWNKGSFDSIYLSVGTSIESIENSPYGNIAHSGYITGTSYSVSNIPLTGNPIFVRLWYKINNVEYFKDYSFSTTNQIASPPSLNAVATPIDNSTFNFTWSKGEFPSIYLSVGTSKESIANAPYGNIYHSSGYTSATSQSVTGIPLNGDPLYVRLWYKVNNIEVFKDYTVSTIKQFNPPSLTSPTVGTPINQTTLNLTWNKGDFTSTYLSVGTTMASIVNSPYGDIVHTGYIPDTSRSVPGIQLNGRKVYVRLWYKLNNVEYSKDYTFVTVVP